MDSIVVPYLARIRRRILFDGCDIDKWLRHLEISKTNPLVEDL